MLSGLVAYVRGIGRRRSVAAETDDELQFHLEQEIAAHVARGVPAGEARRLALRDLGGLTQTAEAVGDVRTIWFDTLCQDLRDVARRLRREPSFTAVAVLTLTLAVGANTAILSVADAVLFRPLPYRDPDRVFVIQMMDRMTGTRSTMTPYSFVDAIDDLHGDMSAVGMMDSGPSVVETTPDGPRSVPTIAVSAGYFAILGVSPARGRIFGVQDAGREGRVALLSYAAWRQRFGGDDAVVGKSVAIGSTTFNIAGVLPQGFVYPSFFSGGPEVITEMPPHTRGTAGGTFNGIVRVAGGVSRARAQTEIDAAGAAVAAADPTWKDSTPALTDVRSNLYGLAPAPIMRFLLVSAGLILLLGCANLANLLLVRGHRHMRDTAVRLALGAGRARLIRPILFEGLFIALASAGLAVGATTWLFDLLLRQIPAVAYGNAPVGVSLRVATISLGISLAGALLFSAMPAWRAARLDVLPLIHGGVIAARRRAWLGRPMVIVQVALSVIAVFGAVIAARAFVSALNIPLGFSPNGVVRINVAQPRRPQVGTARAVALGPGRIEVADLFPPPSVDTSVFYARVLDALKARPEVVSAGASTGLPLSGEAPYASARLPGTTAGAGVGIEYVLPGFFETIGMPILRGRALTSTDFEGDRAVAVISDAASRKLFPGADPVGQVFVQDRTEREFRVVGVVADVRQSLEGLEAPRTYVFPANRGGILSPVVRVRDRNDAVLIDLKAAVRAAAPESLVTAQWWSDTIGRNTAYRNPRFQTMVLGVLGLLALTLTALGVFGVVNHLVVSRTREMGVRLAMGASPSRLVLFVLQRAVAPVLVGVAAGLLAIRWMRPLAEAQLFKVDTRDPRTLVASAGVVIVAALAAAYLPARRAARVDPVAALKSE